MIQQCVARGWCCASRQALGARAARRGVNRGGVWRRTLAAQVEVSDAAPARDVSEKVTKLADSILELNLMEISDLSSILKDKLGLDALPMGGMMPMAAAPAAGAAPGAEAAEAPAAAEKTTFDVKLESFDSSSKIKVIKEVRAFTELGLKEAKEKVEQAPVVLKEGVDKKTAEEIKKTLEDAGGVVILS